MALTSTWGDVKGRILIDLRDPRQTNPSYSDPKLLDAANRTLGLISEEVSRWGQELGESVLDFGLTSPTNQAALPAGFLDFGTDERHLPRIYVVVDSNQSQLRQATKYEADRFEGETSPELGTPTRFYIRGGSIYLKPKPSLDCTLRIYGYVQEHIDGPDDVLPWNGMFNELIRADVVKRARLLLQHFRYTLSDEREFQRELNKVKRRALGRKPLEMRPRHGWD